MRVAKVLDPASNAVSFTLVGVTGVVEPAERYLRYLAETERSPNTIKAHAHDLKDWFVFLDEYGHDRQSVTREDVGAFIRWLRPSAAHAWPGFLGASGHRAPLR
jgi:integrase/recombinase XerD